MIHLLNVIKDLFDPRDRTVAPAAPGSSVKVSFRSDVPYIKNQGSAGSCTAHAGTEMLELLYRKQKSNLPLSIDRKTLRFSPLFQYAQERMQAGTFSTDAGADSRTIFTVLKEIGCCLETEDPYSDKSIYVNPTPEQIAEAAQFKIGAYHRILDVDTAKTVIDSGYSFTIGIPLFNQFQSMHAMDTGEIAVPKSGDTSIGGHEMHVIGRDDSKQVLSHTGAFEVQNSWGEDWGDNGFCWIPYDYFTATEDQWDMWTAHFGKPWVPKST
jgi:C1A family cysteine protease